MVKNLEDNEESVIFAKEKGSYRLDRDTHQIIRKTGMASLANGGPRLPQGG